MNDVTPVVSKDDRVWMVLDPDHRVRQHVGTVVKVSPAGYVHIRWDGTSKTVEVFSPDAVRFGRIKVVTGEDAQPRHEWIEKLPFIDGADPRCQYCDIVQDDDNEFGPCFARERSQSC